MLKLGSCALAAHAQYPLMSSLIKPCTIFMLTHVALPQHVVEMHNTCDKRVWCILYYCSTNRACCCMLYI